MTFWANPHSSRVSCFIKCCTYQRRHRIGPLTEHSDIQLIHCTVAGVFYLFDKSIAGRQWSIPCDAFEILQPQKEQQQQRDPLNYGWQKWVVKCQITTSIHLDLGGALALGDGDYLLTLCIISWSLLASHNHALHGTGWAWPDNVILLLSFRSLLNAKPLWCTDLSLLTTNLTYPSHDPIHLLCMSLFSSPLIIIHLYVAAGWPGWFDLGGLLGLAPRL